MDPGQLSGRYNFLELYLFLFAVLLLLVHLFAFSEGCSTYHLQMIGCLLGHWNNLCTVSSYGIRIPRNYVI